MYKIETRCIAPGFVYNLKRNCNRFVIDSEGGV